MDLVAYQLCESCKNVPWGQQGWKDLFSNQSWRSNIDFLCLEFQGRSIHYTVPSQRFFEQAMSCTWCRFLRDELVPIPVQKLPTTGEKVQKQSGELKFSLRFPTSANISQGKLSTVDVLCLSNEDSRFPDMSLTLGVMARQGKLF